MQVKRAFSVAVVVLLTTCAEVRAQDQTPALKDLIAGANKEAALTLSWSPSTYDGAQGATLPPAAPGRW